MEKKKNGKVFFGFSVAGFVLSSLSILCIPLYDGMSDSNSFLNAYLVGVLFWVGLVAGVLTFICAWKSVKDEDEYQSIKKRTHPGAVSFFKTSCSIISDAVFICIFIVIILGIFVLKFPEIISLVLIFVFLITFCLHFLLNGRVFRYLSDKKNLSDSDKK